MNATEEKPRLRDTVDVLVSAPYAKSRYPQRAARGDQRQPLDYAQVMALPDEISTHIVRAAGHARVWVYMLADEGAGVEILNAPLRAHHKPVRIPR